MYINGMKLENTMKKCKNTKLTETLLMSECHDGFWLYDSTRGMNLAMRAKSESEAFVEALTYYQKRVGDMSYKYKQLEDAATVFVESLGEEFKD
mgnify:CR=1 FL=1